VRSKSYSVKPVTAVGASIPPHASVSMGRTQQNKLHFLPQQDPTSALTCTYSCVLTISSTFSSSPDSLHAAGATYIHGGFRLHPMQHHHFG
jgi:hypothetical protein